MKNLILFSVLTVPTLVFAGGYGGGSSYSPKSTQTSPVTITIPVTTNSDMMTEPMPVVEEMPVVTQTPRVRYNPYLWRAMRSAELVSPIDRKTTGHTIVDQRTQRAQSRLMRYRMLGQ